VGSPQTNIIKFWSWSFKSLPTKRLWTMIRHDFQFEILFKWSPFPIGNLIDAKLAHGRKVSEIRNLDIKFIYLLLVYPQTIELKQTISAYRGSLITDSSTQPRVSWEKLDMLNNLPLTINSKGNLIPLERWTMSGLQAHGSHSPPERPLQFLKCDASFKMQLKNSIKLIQAPW